MKIFLFLISIVFASQVFAEQTCFYFEEGPKEITIGFQNKKTVKADTMCLPGTFEQTGMTPLFDFVLKNGVDVVAEYKAYAEKYSEKNVRITLMNGESEPQQFEAIIGKKSNKLLSISFAESLIPASSNGKFTCAEESDIVGVYKTLELTQIENSTQWKLEVFSTPVVPNATKTLIFSSILQVQTSADTLFYLKNEDGSADYTIYMDELYATYLTINGKNYSFDCSTDE